MSTFQLLDPVMSDQDQIAALELRLREQEQWSAQHDGKIIEKWHQQELFNEDIAARIKDVRLDMETKFAMVFRKLTSLEVKVALFSAVAAAGGTILARYVFP